MTPAIGKHLSLQIFAFVIWVETLTHKLTHHK